MTAKSLVLALMVVSLLLLSGCGGGGGGHDHDDFDTFVIRPLSSSETLVFRDSGGPFNLLWINVRPFRDAFGVPFRYQLDIVGEAFIDGKDIVFQVRDQLADQQFFDPLREEVVDALIECNCFVVSITVETEERGTETFFVQ